MATKTKPITNNRIADETATLPDAGEILTFDIIGISPLLQNNPAEFIGVADEVGLSKAKKKYNDEEEARARLYTGSSGLYYHPSCAFIRAMLRAVTNMKFGKLAATRCIQGAVFATETESVLLDADGEPLTEYTIDRRSVVIVKNRVLRCRPCFPEWRVRLALEVDRDFLQESHVREALSRAGRIVGIGDYRPDKGGAFGRFRVG